jgi:hypothetical protein
MFSDASQSSLKPGVVLDSQATSRNPQSNNVCSKENCMSNFYQTLKDKSPNGSYHQNPYTQLTDRSSYI